MTLYISWLEPRRFRQVGLRYEIAGLGHEDRRRRIVATRSRRTIVVRAFSLNIRDRKG